MTKETHPKKTFLKIFIVVAIAAGVIVIFKGGYKTGTWLYEITHK